MKLRYMGQSKRRRLNGEPLENGQVVEEAHEGSAAYLLSLRLNDGSPEFVEDQPRRAAKKKAEG